MSDQTHKFEVGQTIYVEDGRRHRGAAVIEEAVTSVGRKWIGFGCRSRFDRETMCVDNGGVGWTRRVWLSREAYDDYRSRDVLWSSLRDAVSRHYAAPSHLSSDVMRDFLRALKDSAHER